MTEETKLQTKQRAVRVEQITLPDGTVAWKYDDGSVRNERGHMVEPIPGKHTITQADASKLARQRWEVSRQAFAEGVAEGTIGKGAAPVEAWSAIGKKAATLLQEAKGARGFADLARFAGEAGGFVPMARGREEMQEQPSEQPQIVVLILQYLSALSSGPADVVEGEIKE